MQRIYIWTRVRRDVQNYSARTLLVVCTSAHKFSASLTARPVAGAWCICAARYSDYVDPGCDIMANCILGNFFLDLAFTDIISQSLLVKPLGG